jgi:hypothetical protein
VIDEAGEVGILEVDPDRKDVAAAAGLVDQAAGKIRPGTGKRLLIEVDCPIRGCEL